MRRIPSGSRSCVACPCGGGRWRRPRMLVELVLVSVLCAGFVWVGRSSSVSRGESRDDVDSVWSNPLGHVAWNEILRVMAALSGFALLGSPALIAWSAFLPGTLFLCALLGLFSGTIIFVTIIFMSYPADNLWIFAILVSFVSFLLIIYLGCRIVRWNVRKYELIHWQFSARMLLRVSFLLFFVLLIPALIFGYYLLFRYFLSDILRLGYWSYFSVFCFHAGWVLFFVDEISSALFLAALIEYFSNPIGRLLLFPDIFCVVWRMTVSLPTLCSIAFLRFLFYIFVLPICTLLRCLVCGTFLCAGCGSNRSSDRSRLLLYVPRILLFAKIDALRDQVGCVEAIQHALDHSTEIRLFHFNSLDLVFGFILSWCIGMTSAIWSAFIFNGSCIESVRNQWVALSCLVLFVTTYLSWSSLRVLSLFRSMSIDEYLRTTSMTTLRVLQFGWDFISGPFDPSFLSQCPSSALPSEIDPSFSSIDESIHYFLSE